MKGNAERYHDTLRDLTPAERREEFEEMRCEKRADFAPDAPGTQEQAGDTEEGE